MESHKQKVSNLLPIRKTNSHTSTKNLEYLEGHSSSSLTIDLYVSPLIKRNQSEITQFLTDFRKTYLEGHSTNTHKKLTKFTKIQKTTI